MSLASSLVISILYWILLEAVPSYAQQLPTASPSPTVQTNTPLITQSAAASPLDNQATQSIFLTNCDWCYGVRPLSRPILICSTSPIVINLQQLPTPKSFPNVTAIHSSKQSIPLVSITVDGIQLVFHLYLSSPVHAKTTTLVVEILILLLQRNQFLPMEAEIPLLPNRRLLMLLLQQMLKKRAR